MSFRARLTTFFVLIVVVPMIAMGLLIFRLIGDSQQGKADARASGVATVAAGLYQSESALARGDAETLARAVGGLRSKALLTRFTTLARQAGLARAALTDGTRTLADPGDRTAVAPGAAVLTQGGASSPMTVTVSELTGSQYAHELSGPAVAILVRQGPTSLGSTLPAANTARLPNAGDVTVHGTGYRAVREVFTGFDRRPVAVTILSPLSATSRRWGRAGRSPRR